MEETLKRFIREKATQWVEKKQREYEKQFPLQFTNYELNYDIRI